MIDLHSHILAGVDDGARDLGESVEIARAAVADGVSLVAATPHVRHDFPTTSETMETLVGELRDALTAAGVALELRTGGEIAIDRLDMLSRDDLRRFGLAGNPEYLLLETPYYGWPLDFSLRVTHLRRLGITAVIAHPERNPEVQMQAELLRPLVEQGALVQVTSASIDGRLGPKTRAAARELIDAELVHCVASDAHSPEVRAIGMSSAAAAIRDEDIARWLTADVPGAIAAGRDLPLRPQTDRREVRRRWWKRG